MSASGKNTSECPHLLDEKPTENAVTTETVKASPEGDNSTNLHAVVVVVDMEDAGEKVEPPTPEVEVQNLELKAKWPEVELQSLELKAEVQKSKVDRRLKILAKLPFPLNGIPSLVVMLRPDLQALGLLPGLSIFVAIAGMLRLRHLSRHCSIPRGSECCCSCAFQPWALVLLAIVCSLRIVTQIDITQNSLEIAISVVGLLAWLHVGAFGGYWLRLLRAQDHILACECSDAVAEKI